MLSLLLVAALCSDVGCDYINATGRFPELRSDADCWEMANHLNGQNRLKGQDPRFACLEPAAFARLAGKKEL